MQLADAMIVAASGINAQAERLRVIAENIANADSTGNVPGQDPYRRQLVTFQNVLDREIGVETVQVADRTYDMSDFGTRYLPGHPMADAEGYVKMPNVESVLEMVDMREARRGYEANLGVVEVTRAMLQQTLELLR